MTMLGSKTYTELLDMRYMPFSSVSAATTEGMNAIYQFLSEGRSKKGPLEAQIGRTSFVKAEDVSFIRQLQARILGLTAGEMSWINDLLLPTVMTKDTKFKWRTTQFVPGRMDRNPAFGINGTNERIESTDEAVSKRLGQHYIIDEETFYTEQGQRDFQLEMQYWSVSWAETMALEAWAEIVAPRVESRRSYFTRMQTQYAFNQAILKQRDDMFYAYKNSNGIYPWLQENCQYVQRVCGRPVTLMVMPAEKSGLITNGTSMSSFKKAGERGVDLLISRGDLPEIVPGVKVASPPRFSLDPSKSPASPIDNQIAIGDYFEAMFSADTSAAAKFPKGASLDKIYVDIEDRWVALPNLAKCLESCGRLVSVGAGKYKLREGTARAGVANDAKDAAKTLDEWATYFIDNKYRFIVASPFKRYRTQGALFAAAGMHAGFTAISEPLVTKGVNVMTQTLNFNMTAWVGPVVTDGACYLFVPNAFPNGILGGSNAKFIDEAEATKLRDETNWENNDLNRKSLYFMVVNPEGDIDSNYIDLRGRARFAPPSSSTYPNSDFYTAHYGFDQIDEGTDEMLTQPIAPICFRRAFNRWNGTEYVYEPGNGPFGKTEGVGCREMREYGTCVPHEIITKC